MADRCLFARPPLGPGEMLLEGEEAHHAVRVLRLATGDHIRLVDGAGARGRARVVSVERKRLGLVVEAIERPARLPAGALRLVVAPPKGGRFDELVRQATELGCGRIDLLVCERASRPPPLERAQRIAREALKQCGGAHLPAIGTAEIPTLARPGEAVILFDPQGRAPRPGRLAPTTLVVGPEGGLTGAEVAALAAAGAKRVRLVGSVLRIDTAGLAALAVWSAAWEGLVEDGDEHGGV